MPQVFIDRDRCEGTGYCVQVRDDVFRLDASGTAEVLAHVDPRVLEVAQQDLRDAEDLCPTGAISVVD